MRFFGSIFCRPCAEFCVVIRLSDRRWIIREISRSPADRVYISPRRSLNFSLISLHRSHHRGIIYLISKPIPNRCLRPNFYSSLKHLYIISAFLHPYPPHIPQNDLKPRLFPRHSQSRNPRLLRRHPAPRRRAHRFARHAGPFLATSWWWRAGGNHRSGASVRVSFHQRVGQRAESNDGGIWAGYYCMKKNLSSLFLFSPLHPRPKPNNNNKNPSGLNTNLSPPRHPSHRRPPTNLHPLPRRPHLRAHPIRARLSLHDRLHRLPCPSPRRPVG